jgi:hypothetical protein
MEAGPAAGNSRRSPTCHRRCNSAARREARQQLRLRGRFVYGRRGSTWFDRLSRLPECAVPGGNQDRRIEDA